MAEDQWISRLTGVISPVFKVEVWATIPVNGDWAYLLIYIQVFHFFWKLNTFECTSDRNCCRIFKRDLTWLPGFFSDLLSSGFGFRCTIY